MLWDALAVKCKIQDAADTVAMQRILNLSLYDLCGLRPFQSLRRQATITYTASDTTGQWFPADMAGIYGVTDSNKNIYHFRDPTNILDDDKVYRYYFADAAADVSRTIRNMSVTIGSDTVTGGAFTAAEVGEYVSIGKEPGFYQIASTTTLTSEFRALETPDEPVITVRPVGISKVACIDDTATLVAGGIKFYYWAYPLPLTSEEHTIPLPTTRALELLTAMRYWGEYKEEHDEADRFRSLFLTAKSDLMAAEPMPLVQGRQVDAVGRRMTLGRRR